MTLKKFYWIDSYHEYDEAIAKGVLKQLNETYAPLAAEVGFEFYYVDVKDLFFGVSRDKPLVLYNNENLLEKDAHAYVGTYNPRPAVEHMLESIHRIFRSSQSIRLVNTTGKYQMPDKDKSACLALAAELGIPAIPTFHIPHNRNWIASMPVIEQLLGNYPMIGKPKELLSGFGVTKITERQGLRAFLENVSWSPKTYVLQQYINIVSDCRVYTSKGNVIALSMRSPTSGSLGNVSQGAQAKLGEIHPQIAEWSKKIADHLAADYLCVDFLYDGFEFYFSEIETGGGFGSLPQPERLEVARCFFSSGF